MKNLLDFFFDLCLKKSIQPYTQILKLVDNNELRIEETYISDELLDTVLDLLEIGFNENMKECEMKKLYIKDPSMTDKRISNVLSKLKQ